MKKIQSEKLQNLKHFCEQEAVKKILKWVFQILVVLFFGAVTAILFFQTVTMQEGSKEPTISTGERFFMNRMSYKIGDPQREDLIVFKTNASDEAALHIRRVIGLPGETVQIKDGQILIDGEVYVEGKSFPSMNHGGNAQDPISLGTGEYFVLGDNRNNSEDSRHGDIGIVKKAYIEGKIWFQISPWKEIGFMKK